MMKLMMTVIMVSVFYGGNYCPGRPEIVNYGTVVKRVAEMTWNDEVIRMAAKRGLDVINVTWEDTGRYYGSCWGPNISDMTIQVHSYENGAEYPALTCMPVIRYPNFHDLSADMDPDDFFLLVGNESGEELGPVSLTDFVDNLRFYLHDPTSWQGTETGLLAPRDSVVLVNAQAVFLPIPSDGIATFNPVLYNYQSYRGDPAVLTILVTREGTSVTVIDNSRDAVPGTWTHGQRLFFNDNGERASLTGTRISDYREEYAARGGDPAEISEKNNLNMVLLIQVPLKQKNPVDTGFDNVCVKMECLPAARAIESDRSADVESAVIGHGELEGPFTEIDHLAIERDPNFPIRVTVQFYKATSNGIVTKKDIDAIADELEKVYEDGSYVGSLVVPDPGTFRPTDWDRASVPRRLRRYRNFFRHALSHTRRPADTAKDGKMRQSGA